MLYVNSHISLLAEIAKTRSKSEEKMAKVTAYDVIWYYPNIVGYLRVLSMILAFYFSNVNWQICTIFYLLAFAGDVVDGYIARLFNQSSKYGGILDMITDRVSTCGFLTILSSLYPSYSFYFIMLIVLDISSHWFHVMRYTYILYMLYCNICSLKLLLSSGYTIALSVYHALYTLYYSYDTYIYIQYY